MSSKAQQMGEARDASAMGVLMRAVHAGHHTPAAAEAITNFCHNEAIKAGTKQARINMYNAAMRRSLFVEGLPVGTSIEQVKRLMQSKLFASPMGSHALDNASALCSVFLNKPPDYAEYMYAVVTMNDTKHAQGILRVMDEESSTGTKTTFTVEGIGVSVQLWAKVGEAPTSQALARSYGNFIERFQADLRRGVVPALPPRSLKGPTTPAKPALNKAPVLAPAPVAVPSPASAPVPTPSTLPPLVKAFSRTQPKKMAVFHDAENCYLGKARSGVTDGELAYNYYSAVRDLVIAEGGDGSGSWQLFLHHQEHLDSHPSKLTLQELSSLGVDNIDPGPKPGAVDIKMKDNIASFCEANKAGADNFIVVILSGDKDFAADLRNLKRAGFRTVVAHPPDVAQAFVSLAKESGTVLEWQPIRQAAGGLEFGDAALSKKYRPPSRARVGYSGTPSAVNPRGWNVESWLDTGVKAPAAAGRDWDELATVRKGRVCSTDNDDCASESSISGSECSLSSASLISSVSSPCTAPPSVSQWLKTNQFTFAHQALQDFGYSDDAFTLMDLVEDVKDPDTLAEILQVVDGIPDTCKPLLNKMKRALKQLASSGAGGVAGGASLAAASA